jgi:hypothetical protein
VSRPIKVKRLRTLVEIRPIVNLGLMRNDAPTDNSGDTVKLAALEMGVASGIVGIVDQAEGAHLSAAAGGHGWPGAIHPGLQTSRSIGANRSVELGRSNSESLNRPATGHK